MALLALNPGAHGGRGHEIWARLKNEVTKKLNIEVVQTTPATGWYSQVSGAIKDGIRIFIAGGGDGTVNSLLNAIVLGKKNCALSDFSLGALGLGSSNDFHKPVREYLHGIPVKINTEKKQQRDIGMATFIANNGKKNRHYFIISAAIGVVAEANHFFNTGDGIQEFLKRNWTEAGIIHAALRTIVMYRNFPVHIKNKDALNLKLKLTNLSVLKTPFLSGSFCYDSPVTPDDGRFSVNICENMSLTETLQTLVDLARGIFLGKPKRQHMYLSEFEVRSKNPVALELDGEVFQARKVRFECLDERINECM
ncbi:diacylglycerol/lipid kinase family protein [Candidatus Riflebacteria bacterium]